MRFGVVLCICLACVCPVAAQGGSSPFLSRLTQTLQQKNTVRQNPGMNRLNWMRLYFPSQESAWHDGFWTRLYKSFSDANKQRTVAFYLYQMYISSAAYGGEIPSRLTVNYLGALDALERLDERFDLRGVETFYQHNKPEIKTWLKRFFEQAHLLSYEVKDPRNDAVELRFLRALVNSAESPERAGYALEPARWKSAVTKQDLAWLGQVQRQTTQESRQKVLLYEVDGIDLAIMHQASAYALQRGTQYLYRPAAKECAACSYLSCARICRQLGTVAPVGRRHVRLYQLQVHPRYGEFLQPAQAAAFHAPDGTEYPAWYYHEAVLVVIGRNGQYTPVVLDPFLSAEPVPLEKWLSWFRMDDTLLYAYPFRRWNETEERLVRPARREGKRIFQNGRAYDPLPAAY